MSDAVDAGAESPSYVSDPEVADRGIEVYIDCTGVIEDAMTATLRRILTEELEAAGYTGRVSAVIHAVWPSVDGVDAIAQSHGPNRGVRPAVGTLACP